jgi:GT2 family glycosyltransferase
MVSPLVSIIVLNHNGAEHLPPCLESLLAQDYQNIEIIVADNGSTDVSREVCARYNQIIFANLGYNYGFGRGNNEGASYASGEFLFFVNNDMRFEPQMVGVLVETINRDGTIFALDSKQYDWSGSRIVHSATCLKRGGGLRSQFCPFIDWIQLDVAEIVPVPWANGASLFCRKEMFLQLGGFDPTFFIDYEDTDLCWRAWLRGWKTLYVPQSECFHKVAATFSSESDRGAAGQTIWTPWKRKRYFSGQKNRVRFIMKTMGWRINTLTFLRNHVLALIFLAQGKPVNASTMLRSWWANILELPEIRTLRQQSLMHSSVTSEQLIETFLI